MLVLQRNPGERILIGGGITIQIVEVRRDGSVRIGIDAPREVPIWREELAATMPVLLPKGSTHG